MTTEEEFFKAFGVEPQIHVDLYDAESYHYPPITPSIVLGLQTIIQRYDVFLKIPRGASISKWTLKRCIELEQFAKISKEVKELFNDK